MEGLDSEIGEACERGAVARDERLLTLRLSLWRETTSAGNRVRRSLAPAEARCTFAGTSADSNAVLSQLRALMTRVAESSW